LHENTPELADIDFGFVICGRGGGVVADAVVVVVIVEGIANAVISLDSYVVLLYWYIFLDISFCVSVRMSDERE